MRSWAAPHSFASAGAAFSGATPCQRPDPLLQEKEDWINAVGRAIVRHSKSMMDRDQVGGAAVALPWPCMPAALLGVARWVHA
jgi:hypothetical protein